MDILRCVFSVCIVFICYVDVYSARNGNGRYGGIPAGGLFLRPGSLPQLRTSSMMLHYVITRGCDYVMGFVKGHYYSRDQGHTDKHFHTDETLKTCDWKLWVEKLCHAYHIPAYLCCALVDCGASMSMVALGASSDMTEQCNMTEAVHAMVVGKRSNRHNDPPSTSRMCEHFLVANPFGKRHVSVGVGNSMSVLDVSVSNVTNLPYSASNTNDGPNSINSRLHSYLTQSMPNLNNYQRMLPVQMRSVLPPLQVGVHRWCKKFSRYKSF